MGKVFSRILFTPLLSLFELSRVRLIKTMELFFAMERNSFSLQCKRARYEIWEEKKKSCSLFFCLSRREWGGRGWGRQSSVTTNLTITRNFPPLQGEVILPWKLKSRASGIDRGYDRELAVRTHQGSLSSSFPMPLPTYIQTATILEKEKVIEKLRDLIPKWD